MSDVIIQAQSTLFNRQGTTTQYKGLLGWPVQGAIDVNGALTTWPVSSQLCADEQAAMDALVSQNDEIIGGGLTLYNIQALNPALFPGAADLELLYTLDPFSATYAASTLALYNDSYATARATAQSGPTNVRGGTARQGIELAVLDTLQSINRFKEIWENQVRMSQVVIAAAELANRAQQIILQSQLQAQQQQASTEQGKAVQILSAAEQLARDKENLVRMLAFTADSATMMTTNETLSGQGFQSAVNTSFGMSSWR